MSPLPKKKLCWNCEGNVEREINNCPYCGVYLHGSEPEEEAIWSSPKISTLKNEPEESPAPSYRLPIQENATKLESITHPSKQNFTSLWPQIKTDVLPALLLMSGSVFFLFGIILLLFSHEGALTLQWKEEYGLYFVLLAVPSLLMGWRYLQQIDENEAS